MPWAARSARRFTRKAASPTRKRQWSKTANAALKRGMSEKSAIRIANAAVKKSVRKRRKRR